MYAKITACTARPIFTFDASDDAFWRKLMLFGIEVSPNFDNVFKIPENPQNFAPKGDFLAK
jgi:hypothetical protein